MAQVKNSKPFVSYFVFIVGMMMALFPQATVQNAKAGTDAAGLASTATGTATGMIGIASLDSGKAAANCACQETGGTCAGSEPWVTCAAIDVAVLGMAGSIASMFMNQSSHDASVGAGAGNMSNVKTFDPDKPLAPQLGCSTDVCCADAQSSLSPICSSDALKKLPGEIQNARNMIASGSLKPADGKSVDEALASLDAAAAQASQLAGGVVPDSGGATAQGFTGDPSNTLGGSRSRTGANGSVIEGNGSGGGGDYGATKTVAGPADRSGLGATLWNGKLDMIDDATGRSLTLWQRATRRYQGEQGKRAFMLARTEGLRMNRFLTLKRSANPPVAQAAPAKAPQAPAPAANRKPASLRPLH